MTSGTRIRLLHETEAIQAFLERDRAWTAYALCDLDPPYRARARFVGALRRDELAAVLLLYSLGGTVVVWPFGEVDAVRAIFRDYDELPSSIFMHVLADHLPALEERYVVRDRWRMIRMALPREAALSWPETHQPTRLGPADMPAIRALYDVWGTTFFDSVMIRYGVYFGLWSGEDLVAVAGTHTISDRLGVASIGGVFTHPAFRGRGLATATTGAVARQLREQGVDLIVLNVRDDNLPALAAYRRLGFGDHIAYFEGHAALRASAADQPASP